MEKVKLITLNNNMITVNFFQPNTKVYVIINGVVHVKVIVDVKIDVKAQEQVMYILGNKNNSSAGLVRMNASSVFLDSKALLDSIKNQLKQLDDGA